MRSRTRFALFFSLPSRPFALAAALLLAATASLYLSRTWTLVGGLGFPLDDSWIHQVLARNLALHGRLAFHPGEPSAASTAPLWTFLLALGYRAGLNPYLWAHLLGTLSLGVTGWLTYRLGRRLFPQESWLAPAAGLLVFLEWHLAWAAFSGMETALFVLLTLLFLLLALEERTSPWVLGAVGALATLTRPEGFVLFLWGLVWRMIGPVGRADTSFRRRGLDTSSPQGSWARRRLSGVLRPMLGALIPYLALVGPYLLLNALISGRPLPSTFYAKHAFYSQGFSLTLSSSYLWGVLQFFTSGPLLLLLPGLAFLLVRGFGRREDQGSATAAQPRELLLVLGWVGGLIGVYLVWLPVLYHHGRYLMPTLPLLLLLGLAGSRELLARLHLPLLRRIAPFLLLLQTLGLWWNGGGVYAWNVKFINDEQVAVASWLRDNTASDSLIATHDVGAIGYFSQRAVIDTAGLVSQDFTDAPRDYGRVVALMQQRGVEYLIFFPRWYPWVAQDPRFEEVYRIQQGYAVDLGGDNMVVARVHWEQVTR